MRRFRWYQWIGWQPCLGLFYDRLVDSGGTAIFEETVEMIGLRETMVARGANESAKSDIASAYDKAEAYCHSVQQFSVSPGNFAGGLTTIEEKSMGAFAKSGHQPIQGVIRVAEAPPPWPMDAGFGSRPTFHAIWVYQSQ